LNIIIKLPQDVAHTQLGKTKLITLLKQMGAEVIGEETSQNNDVPAAEDVQELFDYHQSILGSHFPRGLKLNTDRRRIIRARRRRFSVEELKQCIDYVAQSPFHLGKNDANKKYLDFDHIMSNDKKVERKLDESVSLPQKSEAVDQIRLTLQDLGARMRSGRADYSDKEKFSRLVVELRGMTGEAYNWKDDAFTLGE